MNARVFQVVSAWALAAGLLGLVATVARGDVSPQYKRLESGLRICVIEDHTLPLVSVQLWYGAGSACDPPTRPGLCATVRTILEHRDSAAAKLRAAGLQFESETLCDACRFSATLPPESLDYVLAIEAGRMQPLTATPELVAEGLNAAALQYATHTQRDPQHEMLRHVLAAMFPNHPYQYPPGFVAASLEKLSAEEVNEFLQRWFVPGNATLLVYGDVDPPVVFEKAVRHLGGLEWLPMEHRPEPPRVADEVVRVCIPTDGDPQLIIAWRTPPLGYYENAAIDVLMDGLCNPVDGPLCQQCVADGLRPPEWKRYAWRNEGLLVLFLYCDTPNTARSAGSVRNAHVRTTTGHGHGSHGDQTQSRSRASRNACAARAGLIHATSPVVRAPGGRGWGRAVGNLHANALPASWQFRTFWQRHKLLHAAITPMRVADLAPIGSLVDPLKSRANAMAVGNNESG